MKTYVIGDIHGCFDEFESLMTKIDPDLRKDKLVILGDYIDRGLKSWETVQKIRKLQERYGSERVVLLRGNHEQMAIDYVLHKEINYLYNGGRATIESFRRNGDNLENYIDCFMNLPVFHEDRYFIYVHGGIRPGISLASQVKEDMLWLREEFFLYPNTTGKTVIFGHTPTPNINKSYCPARINNNIALDTGCVFGGYLSALEIDQGEVCKVYQTINRKAS